MTWLAAAGLSGRSSHNQLIETPHFRAGGRAGDKSWHSGQSDTTSRRAVCSTAPPLLALCRRRRRRRRDPRRAGPPGCFRKARSNPSDAARCRDSRLIGPAEVRPTAVQFTDRLLPVPRRSDAQSSRSENRGWAESGDAWRLKTGWSALSSISDRLRDFSSGPIVVRCRWHRNSTVFYRPLSAWLRP